MKPGQSSFSYLLNDIMLVIKAVKTSIKRFSPFLLLTALFIFLFPYFLYTGKGNIQSLWPQLVLFPAIFANVFYCT
jgi:hypothetical protein